VDRQSGAGFAPILRQARSDPAGQRRSRSASARVKTQRESATPRGRILVLRGRGRWIRRQKPRHPGCRCFWRLRAAARCRLRMVDPARNIFAALKPHPGSAAPSSRAPPSSPMARSAEGERPCRPPASLVRVCPDRPERRKEEESTAEAGDGGGIPDGSPSAGDGEIRQSAPAYRRSVSSTLASIVCPPRNTFTVTRSPGLWARKA